MKNNRREIIKLLSLTGGAAALDVWKKPVVNTVLLPAHAQISVATVNCSALDSQEQPLPEGGTTSGNVEITFVTNPPLPGAAISWVGQCNGVDDFPVQSDVLNANGEFTLTVQTLLLCSGGPPSVGDVITHRLTLNANGNSAACSYVFGNGG